MGPTTTIGEIINRLVNDGKGAPISGLAATPKQRHYWQLISLRDSEGRQVWTYEEAATIAYEEGRKV